MSDVDEIRTLVLAAFQSARQKGKPEWKRMTLAVLKNRLLQMTDGEFHLDAYTVDTMAQWVAQVPDVVHFDAGPPSHVWLSDAAVNELEVAAEGAPTPSASDETDWKSIRIRQDLWNGILDFTSSSIYVWDPLEQIVRPKRVTDGSDVRDFPTLTVEELSSWRGAWVMEIEGDLGGIEKTELAQWANGPGRVIDLPPRLRGRYLEWFKRRITDRIEHWFSTNGLRVPLDVHVPVSARVGGDGHSSIRDVVDEQRLRSQVIRAVGLMTFEELRGLQLPAGLITRLLDKR